MDLFSNYALFAIKLATVIIGILLLIAGIAAIAGKGKSKTKGKLTINKLNDKYKEYHDLINHHIHEKHLLKKLKKHEKKALKAIKDNKIIKSRLYVLNFHGDIRASAVASLTEEINALLLVAKPQDQVLVRLESGGGMVNAYGLAASQLQRIKAANIHLTVAVDKVAASGGYMMACVADRIIAAPFAIIGSIGVLAQLPNFHRYLKNKAIDFEQLTAGDYKRTLTIFGENTKQGRQKLQEEIDDTHELFKDFISQNRNSVDIKHVATGEHWFAKRALDLKLVDELKTSDDFLLQTSKEADIYQIAYKTKQKMMKRLAANATSLMQLFLNRHLY